MQLFAGADSDVVNVTSRSNRLGHFEQAHAGNLGNKNFSSVHVLDAIDHKPDTVIEREPEARHPRIGDGNSPALALFEKYGNYAAPAANYIAVAGATEACILLAGVGVGLHEHFFRAKFCCAIKIDRVHGFIGAQRQNPLHAPIDGCVDHVAPADDVGLNRLKRIVFAGWHLLESCRMNNHADPGKRALQTLRIAHITDEIAQRWVVESCRSHIVLFEFVPAKNDELFRVTFAQHHLHKFPAE